MSGKPDAPHPLADLLARYGAVLRAAWAARAQLAGPRLTADEAAFLPAALSLQATPVHPAPRLAMALIVALLAGALAWSVVGQVDIVAVAQGRIVVDDKTKLVQPLEAGIVRAIHVKDGDAVRAGQVLVELDATLPQADAAQVREQRQVAESERLRSRAILHALNAGNAQAGGNTPVLQPPAAGNAASASAQAQLSAEWHDIQAQRARQQAEAARRDAELATATQQLSRLQALLPLARNREADYLALVAQGFVSGHASQDRVRERIDLEHELSTQQARVQEAQAAQSESRQARAAWWAELQRRLSERANKAEQDLAQLAQSSAKTEQRARQQQLRAPVDGVVLQLAVHTVGGVVTPAQTLLVVVPQSPTVTAEVVIDNKDIGFVHVGQRAEVKVDTFNFTRYGTLQAEVVRVAADAVVDERLGARFPAALVLQVRHINIDGKAVALVPGMALTAEVKTGRRRVIDYLWSPLAKTARESLGER